MYPCVSNLVGVVDLVLLGLQVLGELARRLLEVLALLGELADLRVLALHLVLQMSIYLSVSLSIYLSIYLSVSVSIPNLERADLVILARLLALHFTQRHLDVLHLRLID